MESPINTIGICEFNKAKNIFSNPIGIFFASPNSGIQDNTSWIGDFEESLQALKANVLDGMNPDSPLVSICIKIFEFFKHINKDIRLFMLLDQIKVIQGYIIDLIVFQKYFFKFIFRSCNFVKEISCANIVDEVEPQPQNLYLWIFVADDRICHWFQTFVSNSVMAKFNALKGWMSWENILSNSFDTIISNFVIE